MVDLYFSVFFGLVDVRSKIHLYVGGKFCISVIDFIFISCLIVPNFCLFNGFDGNHALAVCDKPLCVTKDWEKLLV